MGWLVICLVLCVVLMPFAAEAGGKGPTQAELIRTVLQNTKPLEHPRRGRLPLYLWSVRGVGTDDDESAERIIRELDARGIGVIGVWDPHKRKESLAEALRIAMIQKKLGLRVNVDANRCTYRFCDGSDETAHVDEKGGKFFDLSFSPGIKMGCPFALEHRFSVVAEQVEYFAREYKKRGLDVDFVFADWEIDGAIEWNDAWANSKRCVRCRENIEDIDDFASFQAAVRKVRSRMQRETYADVMRKYFPKTLVGNYGVYPHDGLRYWYDWFERFVEGAPFEADGRAKYRAWFDEFPLTHFTFAMPVVYTWIPIYTWYDFKNTDYRWFYNMLLVASNAGRSTPADVPIVTFVHWTTVRIPSFPKEEKVEQMSEETYQELLWHMLLRGHDTFFVWTPRALTAVETRLVHEVYAASLEYAAFLDKGKPVTFDVPKRARAVVSALQLGDKLLVRRTDFADNRDPVPLMVGSKRILVPWAKGRCQVLSLP